MSNEGVKFYNYHFDQRTLMEIKDRAHYLLTREGRTSEQAWVEATLEQLYKERRLPVDDVNLYPNGTSRSWGC